MIRLPGLRPLRVLLKAVLIKGRLMLRKSSTSVVRAPSAVRMPMRCMRARSSSTSRVPMRGGCGCGGCGCGVSGGAVCTVAVAGPVSGAACTSRACPMRLAAFSIMLIVSSAVTLSRTQQGNGEYATVCGKQRGGGQPEGVQPVLALDHLQVGPIHADAAQYRQAYHFAQVVLAQEGRPDLAQEQRHAQAGHQRADKIGRAHV